MIRNRLLRIVTVVLVSVFAVPVCNISASASAESSSAPITAVCTAQGDVDPYFVEMANDQLSMLPKSLLRQFVADGLWIAVTDQNIDAVYYGGQFGSVMGSTQWDAHNIVIEDRDKAILESTIHEFGHYVDCRAGGISSSNEFLNIYYAETDSFCNAFLVNFYYDNQEFFAEAFRKYYTDPATLAAGCPQTYAWFENLLAEYSI